MENYASKAMTGLSILGSAIGPNPDVTAMTFIVLGKYDAELSVALYFQRYGFATKDAAEEKIIADPGVASGLENVKNWLRNILANAIEAECKEIDLLKKIEFRDLVAQQKEAQKPHAQGTVAEIAAKFGISKSEVRRLKADGKLDEFIQQHSNAA